MGAGTLGNGDDTEKNICGIAKSHAYTILGAFTMVSNGQVHKCLMIRNPWGLTTYNQEWSKDDNRWNENLISQVPFNVDVRILQDSEGVFIIPIENL